MSCAAKKHIENLRNSRSTTWQQLHFIEVVYRDCSTACSELGKELSGQIHRKEVQKQAMDFPTTTETTRSAAKKKRVKQPWFKRFW